MSKRPSRAGATLLAGALACLCLAVRAEVKLDPIFTDHAVLQHGKPLVIWGKADPGETVKVTLAGQAASTVAQHTGEWRLTLPPLSHGGPYELTATGPANSVTRTDVLLGEVWLCGGQSNMDFTIARTEERYWCGVLNEAEVVAAADEPRIRQFKVPLAFSEQPIDEVASGYWMVCSPKTAGEFSAVAYFFARNLREKLPADMPVGLLVSTYGASTAHTWISRPALEAKADLAPLVADFEKRKADWDANREKLRADYAKALAEWEVTAKAAKAQGDREPRKPRPPQDPRKHQHNAALLYNGMISPIIPYTVRGAIWYQGESNGATNELYLSLMQTLIADWRSQWGEQLPFLATQLASYRAPATQPVARSQTASVREAQRLTSLTVPASAMAVTIDIGDESDVHPKNKQDVGKRLALLALTDVYGMQNVVSRGPEPISVMAQTDGTVRVTFAHTSGGLITRAVNHVAANEVRGFTLKDVSGKWVFADARLQSDSVILSSKEIGTPVEVRYAWADFPMANLYNQAGLPAGPFQMEIP